ncbi:MAG: alpha/beta hydrolase fold protein [Frankiales bacterium]|nr:alpha/beta hydrolase fold protein [Frankiales bacterium]
MSSSVTTGYAPVNGMNLYWESRGDGGVPLVVTHGGFGLTTMFGDLLDVLAAQRRVVAIELQGHGHTRDIDRPFSYEAFGDDIAAVIEHLELPIADVLGYSLGGGASVRSAIQHPDLVRRLVLVSTAHRRDAWFPGVRAGMDLIGSAGFAQLSQSPMFAAWKAVAPDPESFPMLMDKTGELLRQPYDWSKEISAMTIPTLLVYGDADSISPTQAAEFFALLGGGLQDAGWDGTLPTEMRMAILPGLTHYNIFSAASLGAVVGQFLT